MMLDRLAGNEPLRRDLAAALSAGRLAHGLLLCGEKGLGAGFAARCLAADYLCPGGGSAAEAVLAGRNDECIEVRGEGASGEIKVDQVREVRRRIQSTALSDAGRVVILYDAQMLNASSGNALLKSIEEPPPGVLFLLTAPSAASLLPTIRSRCAVYTLSPVSEAECAAWLHRMAPAGRRGTASAHIDIGKSGGTASAHAGGAGGTAGNSPAPARAGAGSGAGTPAAPTPEQLAALYAGEIGRALEVLQSPARAAVLADAMRLAGLAAQGQEYPLLTGLAGYEAAKKPKKAEPKKAAGARRGRAAALPEPNPGRTSSFAGGGALAEPETPPDPAPLLLQDLACIGSAVLRGKSFCGLTPQKAARMARGAQDALRALAGNVNRKLVLTNLAISLAEP